MNNLSKQLQLQATVKTNLILLLEEETKVSLSPQI